MKQIRVSAEELDGFIQLVLRERWNWPATFSCNPSGEVWPFATFSYTPPEERVDVRGQHQLLDSVADQLLSERRIGGRFFINVRGAYWKTKESDTVQFVEFVLEN